MFLFALIVTFLAVYLFILNRQIRYMRRQLEKRRTHNTRQPISLGLIDYELNLLAARMNECLQQEQNAEAKRQRHERQFKEMIANISHDLRTPLTAIKGYLQLIEQGTLDNEQQAKLLIIQKHVLDLESLIEHFWEYSYLSGAEREPYFEKINLTNLITECLAEHVALLEAKGLQIKFENKKMIYISADKEYLLRIIRNLIRNCIRYSDGDIVVSLITTNNKVAISFSNPVRSGVNIETSKIFDRFYVADTARSKTGGLGLSIVKLLTLQLKGDVYAIFENEFLDVRVEFPLIQKV